MLLIKPQFEAGRVEVSRGRGVVRSPETWARVLHSVVATYDELGAAMMAVMTSPITGADGNVEFLAHFQMGSSSGVERTNSLIDAAVLSSADVHAVESDAGSSDPGRDPAGELGSKLGEERGGQPGEDA